MTFDWSSLFLFTGIFHCIAGLITLFALPKEDPKNVTFLFLLLLSLAVILIERISRFSSIYLELPQLLFISGPFLFFIYPLTYLFQTYLIKGPKYWFLHLALPITSVIFLPSYRMSGTEKLSMYSEGLEDPIWFTISYLIYSVGYMIAIFRNNVKHSYLISSLYADVRVDYHRAINRFITIGSATYLCLPIAFFIGYLNLDADQLEVSRKALFVVFSFNPLLLLFALITSKETSSFHVHSTDGKRKAVLSTDEISKWERLNEYMEKQQPFLIQTLTLSELSDQTNIGRSELSRIINANFKNNFYEFINNYRVAHVIERIRKGDHNLISLEGLTTESGFRSYTTFYRAFKKTYKKTPRSFIKELESVA